MIKNHIPETAEELYMACRAQESQHGYPPQASGVPHALWAFYKAGVKLRAAC